ncbi:DUF7472 family protein [Natronobacterium texcoconense]|uniref:Uncharacterized protein n=1 Tax=Natronobacterium texcoconense TaxID=1095778 RepID=A0A1H1HR28_NATTX|nr:hypothetical protein [Natronobacterium texcoconense]SDR27578.1 hypothetical protein SAMN04489842_2952 [Natronobacterium texcoconense]
MLERKQIIEIAVAVSSVLLMIGAMIGIGMMHGGDDSILTPEGAELLVWAIVGFVLLLTIVGIGLAFLLNEPGEGLEDENTDAQSAV